MTLQQLRDLLLTVTPNTYHYDASGAEGNYIVWAEDGQAESLWADGEMQEQTLSGTIDYFTKQEYDPLLKNLQQALTAGGISWSLNSIQYEDDTKYIHYEWVWDIG